MSFLTPLFLGFIASGLLAMVDDFRRHKVLIFYWIPSTLGLGYTYYEVGSALLVEVSLFYAAATVVVFWVVNKRYKQKAGFSDLLALAFFGAWPSVGVLAVVGALLVAGVGGEWRINGEKVGLALFSHGIPLAGLIGAAGAFIALSNMF